MGPLRGHRPARRRCGGAAGLGGAGRGRRRRGCGSSSSAGPATSATTRTTRGSVGGVPRKAARFLTDPTLGAGALDTSVVYSRGENQASGDAVGTMPDDPTILDELAAPELRGGAASTSAPGRRSASRSTDAAAPERAGETTRAIPERERGPRLRHLRRRSRSPAARTRPTETPSPPPDGARWSPVPISGRTSPRRRGTRPRRRLAPPRPLGQPVLGRRPGLGADAGRAGIRLGERHARHPRARGRGRAAADRRTGSPARPRYGRSYCASATTRGRRQLVVSGALDTPGNDDGIARLADDGERHRRPRGVDAGARTGAGHRCRPRRRPRVSRTRSSRSAVCCSPAPRSTSPRTA